MVLEKVKLNDGSEIEVSVKNISSMDAYRVVEEALKIDKISEEAYDSPLPNGQVERKTRPNMQGSFSGVISIPIKAVSLCVADFPQKDEIDIDDINRLYKKYAEPIISKVMRSSFSPK